MFNNINNVPQPEVNQKSLSPVPFTIKNVISSFLFFCTLIVVVILIPTLYDYYYSLMLWVDVLLSVVGYFLLMGVFPVMIALSARFFSVKKTLIFTIVFGVFWIYGGLYLLGSFAFWLPFIFAGSLFFGYMSRYIVSNTTLLIIYLFLNLLIVATVGMINIRTPSSYAECAAIKGDGISGVRHRDCYYKLALAENNYQWCFYLSSDTSNTDCLHTIFRRYKLNNELDDAICEKPIQYVLENSTFNAEAFKAWCTQILLDVKKM